MPRAFIALVLLLVGPPVWAVEYIRLASWNIENLGYRTPGQRPIALAEHILLASPNILALQEIHDTDEDPMTRTNQELDTAFAMINERPDQDWKYWLFPNKQPNDTSQLCGVAWNARRVAMVGELLQISVEDDPADEFNVWDRHPHAIKFTAREGKTDLVVISLHMKSNFGGQAAATEQRAKEARSGLRSVRSG